MPSPSDFEEAIQRIYENKCAISRPAAASTATGNKKQHEHEITCLLSMFVGSPYKPTPDAPKSGNGGKGGETTGKKVTGGGEPATPVETDTGGTPAPPTDAGDPTLKASSVAPPTSAIPSSTGGSSAAGSTPNSVASIPPISTTPVAANPTSVQAPPVSLHSSPSTHHDIAAGDINISPEVLLTDMKKNLRKKPTASRPEKKAKKSFYINYEMIYEKDPKKKS